jgi:hypothetical protein
MNNENDEKLRLYDQLDKRFTVLQLRSTDLVVAALKVASTVMEHHENDTEAIEFVDQIAQLNSESRRLFP